MLVVTFGLINVSADITSRLYHILDNTAFYVIFSKVMQQLVPVKGCTLSREYCETKQDEKRLAAIECTLSGFFFKLEMLKDAVFP